MKIAVILNPQHDMATLLNAVGHVCIGLAHLVPASSLELRPFHDANQDFIATMTDWPLIIFSARSVNHLRQAHDAALREGVACNVFTTHMKDDTPQAQAQQIAADHREGFDYVALGLVGGDDVLRPLTRRFSLYRA